MASEMVLSPRQVLASPTRRPLQNLHTNMNITPRRLASGKTSSMSPLKSNTPLTPALLLSTRKNENKLTESIMLNPSKKRPIGDVIAVERDHTRASFSSLINFDPSSDNAEPASSATTSDDTMYKSRADTLKLRLQMAMFRVQTNQMQTPFAQLRVPTPPASFSQPMSQNANTSRPTGTPSTPPTRIRSGSASSMEEDITLDNASFSQRRRLQGALDVTSSVVNGDAISGLLELRRGT